MYSDFFKNLKNELSKELPGLSAQLKMAPEERPFGHNKTMLNAGVLILLYHKNEDIHLALIQRPEYNGPHSGQISLPGGKFEEEDKTLVQTALRESFEEIGAEPNEVDVLGMLSPLQIPVSNYFVQPVVGFYKSSRQFKADVTEVEKILEIRLRDLINPENKSVKEFTFGSIRFNAPIYKPDNIVIWGATAMILSEFIEIVNRIKI
ncbi:MAG: CoA pyrophosphatase [Bacteroidales bacterium]|jgi:8-oxo-dGTP pyrophosphatase MutT (NUDIX family)|nr:CoA pyrophosphatase [Bacteroidales bacterium]